MRGILFAAAVVFVPFPSWADALEAVNKIRQNKGNAEEVVKHGEASVSPLGDLARDQTAPCAARYEATNLLGRIGGKAAVAELRSLLRDKNPEVQLAAVFAIAGTAGEHARDAVPDLVALLQARGHHSGFERQLIELIGRTGYGSKEAADALGTCMAKKRTHEAAVALSKLGVPGAEKLITLATAYLLDKRPESDKRYGEAYAVVTGGVQMPAEVLPVFKKHLLAGGKESQVAELAFCSVGKDAVPVLMELLDSTNADVRASAAKALGALNWHARACRREPPVSPELAYAKLKGLLRPPGKEIDYRIADAMYSIDRDVAMADPEIADAIAKMTVAFMIGFERYRSGQTSQPAVSEQKTEKAAPKPRTIKCCPVSRRPRFQR